MNHRVWSSLASLALMSCDMGSIGEDRCVGTNCSKPTVFQAELLDIEFTEVPTLGADPLPISWVSPNVCPSCTEPPRLYAANGAAWHVQVSGAAFTVELIDAAGTRTTQPVDVPAGRTLARSSLTGLSDGRLLAHVLWSGADAADSDEVVLFVPGQSAQSVPLAATTGRRPPPAAIVTETPGFLLFDDGIERGDQQPAGDSVVRSVESDGRTRWQQAAFPAIAAVVSGAAVATVDQFALTARAQSNGGKPVYGLLWLDGLGTVLRVNAVDGSSWRDMALLDRGQDRFVLAASVDLVAAGGRGGEAEGLIELIPFEGVTAQNGFRLMRECYYPLALNGVAADQEGNLYVSSQAGMREAPRGLLCRLPASGTPRCFQTDPMHSLGSIVALGPNILLATLDDSVLIRIDLPITP